MKKNFWARLIFTLIICALTATAVFAGCKKTDKPSTFTVTFDSNGGSSVSSQIIESGKTVTKPEDPVRDGYEFVTWLDIENDEYDFSTAVTSDFTLFAKWNSKSSTDPENPPQTKYFTVNFDSNGGSSVTSVSVESGKTLTKPADPTREGYTFDGWFESGSSTAYDFTKAVTKDFTLTARWTPKQSTDPDNPTVKYFTVRFMDGTAEYKSERVESGKKVTKPTDPSKTGYTFDKWTLSDGTAFSFDTAITADTVLQAKWTKNPTTDPDNPDEPVTVYYTVTFNSGGGSAVLSQYVESGRKAAEPTAPVKSGFIFGGWYKETALTNLYDFNSAVTADVTLHAKWIKDTVTTFTVTFNSNEGSKVLSQEVTVGGKATAPAEPEKNGFVFSGWYTTDAFTALYDFNAEVTKDITLYAKWTPASEAVTFEVKFETDGGSSVSAQEVEKNGKAAKPKDPTKSGYAFGGWYNGNSLYDFNTPVTADLTLTAKWTALPAAKWESYQADFTDSKVSNYSDSKNKTPSEIEVGRFTIGKGVYVENSSKGLKLEKGDVNTQNVKEALTFTLNGNGNKNAISFIYVSASSTEVTIALYKKGETTPVWSETAPSSNQSVMIGYDTENDTAGEITLTAGTYYLGTTGGSARLGNLVISEYIGNESPVTPPASSTLAVPEIPADATKIQVSSTSTYKTITEALTYAATLPSAEIKVIEIADGEYKEKLTISTPNVWLVGSDLTEGASLSSTRNNGVVIWYDDIAGKFDPASTSQSASVTVNATDFTAINITFKNYYNTHDLYQQSLTISTSTQAVALAVNADRAAFYNCKVTSYHDTLLANQGKQLYYNCWIEGRTDYIFGQNAIAYFENCDIWTIGAGASETNGGYVVAQKPSSSDYYYVFNNCRFDGDENVKDGSAALGRPWGAEMKMVVMNSYISGKFSTAAHTNGTTAGQRYCTMSGVDPKPENMIEYNNTGAGAITESIANTCTYISETDAEAYGIRNVLTLNGWNVTGDKQDLITFGSNGNYKDYYDKYGGDGTVTGTATVNDNGANSDNSQVKEGYLQFTVTEGAVVTISSYNGYTNYNVTINGGTPSETITGTSWKYVATGNDTIVITAVSGNNYFYSISILY